MIEASEPLSIKYEIYWFLKIASYCAVNCYGMISGYVMYDKKFKYSNIIYLYFQVLFYTLTIGAIFYFIMPDCVSKKQMIQYLIPIFNCYWYFTAYFALFFIIPFLNKMIKNLSDKEVKILLITITVIYSALPTLFYNQIFNLNAGYSFIWLMFLYLTGACIKRLSSTINYHIIHNRIYIYIYIYMFYA